MKKYKIEFILLDGSSEILEIETIDLPKTILDWTRNKPVKSHRILESIAVKSSKKLLLG